MIELLRDEGGQPLAVRIGGLLPSARLAALLAATLAEERWFVEASTGGSDDHRRALVLYTPVDVATEVVERVRYVAQRAFGCDVARIECQHTAYVDGGFYRVHTDDDGDEAGGRALSYAYYYHRLPRAYRGGALGLYGAGGPCMIEPVLNELVIFRSSLRHEVLDVDVPSGAFSDARFSVNGWLWR